MKIHYLRQIRHTLHSKTFENKGNSLKRQKYLSIVCLCLPGSPWWAFFVYLYLDYHGYLLLFVCVYLNHHGYLLLLVYVYLNHHGYLLLLVHAYLDHHGEYSLFVCIHLDHHEYCLFVFTWITMVWWLDRDGSLTILIKAPTATAG